VFNIDKYFFCAIRIVEYRCIYFIYCISLIANNCTKFDIIAIINMYNKRHINKY